MPKVLIVLGTRPEAVKLAPVLRALARGTPRVDARLCAVGQQGALLAGTLRALGLRPGLRVGGMRPGQSPHDVVERALRGVTAVLRREAPDLLLVQGDTAAAFGAALAAFARGVPVAHVEAGLRTEDWADPFPEEFYRTAMDWLSDLRLAPTPRAARGLRARGLGKGVLATGNTVVDALAQAARAGLPPPPRVGPSGTRLVVATFHRRESFGRPLAGMLEALVELLRRRPDVSVAFPVHPNPEVRGPARGLSHPRLRRLAPLPYPRFLALLARASLAITDSGGLQEEASCLGVPVLVARRVTERPELLRAGGGLLVGTDPRRILREATRLLSDPARLERMARAPNPFGDGRAAERCAAAVRHFLGLGPRPRPWSGRRGVKMRRIP